MRFTDAFDLTDEVKSKGVALGEEFNVTVCTPDGVRKAQSVKIIDPNREVWDVGPGIQIMYFHTFACFDKASD